MGINFEHLNTVEPVTVEEMEHLHTGSLLKRLKDLRSLQECFEDSDWSQEERDAVDAAGLIAFKNSEMWGSAFADVKRLLSEREHLPKGSREKRQKAAREKQSR